MIILQEAIDSFHFPLFFVLCEKAPASWSLAGGFSACGASLQRLYLGAMADFTGQRYAKRARSACFSFLSPPPTLWKVPAGPTPAGIFHAGPAVHWGATAILHFVKNLVLGLFITLRYHNTCRKQCAFSFSPLS